MSALLWLLACAGPTPADKGESPAESTPGADSAGGGDDTPAESAAPACVDLPNPGPLTGDQCVSQAACTLNGTISYGYFAWRVASGADLDGDGADDLLASYPAWDVSAELTDAGRVAIYTGADLLVAAPEASTTIDGAAYAQGLGSGVTLLGDLDGDGLADALVGAHGADGEVGDNNGLVGLLPGADLGGALSLDALPHTWTGESAYARLGLSQTGLGDVDGDGLADLALTGELRDYDGSDESYRAGRVYVVLGGAVDTLPAALPDADATLDGSASYEGAGRGLAGGDLDGDGHGDLIIGAPYGSSYRGRVYAVSGGALSGAISLATITPVSEGSATYDVLGWEVAAGDLTGDGVAELIVGAPLSDALSPAGGAVFVYAGGPDFMSGPTLLATYAGAWDDVEMGTGLAAGRDVTGDGLGDLLVGGVHAATNFLTKNGRSWLISGATDGWPTGVASITDHATSAFHGAGVEDYLGHTGAMGDVNGDGRADLILASAYTNLDSVYDRGSVWFYWGE